VAVNFRHYIKTLKKAENTAQAILSNLDEHDNVNIHKTNMNADL